MKFEGIDLREIKCCCLEPGTIESGISFDFLPEKEQHVLRFHFLQVENINGKKIINQVEKSMYLDESNTKELILRLKEIKSSLKQKRKNEHSKN